MAAFAAAVGIGLGDGEVRARFAALLLHPPSRAAATRTSATVRVEITRLLRVGGLVLLLHRVHFFMQVGALGGR